MIKIPVDPNAIKEVRDVMTYLASIEGKGILTGQHTQTMEQEELQKIQEVTGKLPALCGFELLAYSPNIRLETADEACVTEVERNRGTLKKAWEWAKKGGLLTFTWHWFSPIGGRDKSFYSEKTDYDPEEALKEGTPEYLAFCKDLDVMAALLKPFCDKHVPILWRPFHESEGDWFWWGRKGPKVAKELYRFMFQYFTQKHALHNLIWVWNCPLEEGYVGDAYCDIVSRDLYPPAHAHGAFREEYGELGKLSKQKKGIALAETGIIPDADALQEMHTPWLWYMAWSGEFTLTEKFNSYEALTRLYQHAYAITLDRLPKLYEI
ncbi:MAG: glycosyl hydrolase [Lachnospiraceae bacterium]